MAQNGYPSNECLKGAVALPGEGRTSASINAAFTQEMGSLPEVADIETAGDGADGSRGLHYYGAYDPYTTSSVAQLRYVMRGTQTCGRGEQTIVTLENGSTTTVCMLTLHIDESQS